jgi:hypothetical protein
MDGSSGTFVELYVEIYCSLSLFKGIHGHPPDSLIVQSFVRTPLLSLFILQYTGGKYKHKSHLRPYQHKLLWVHSYKKDGKLG